MSSISIHSLVLVTSIILVSNLPTKVEACNASECVHVEIYYEALCPDSRRFITNQLAPTYKDLGQYLDLKFVPYGKAKHYKNPGGKWVFECQHKQAECEGNRGQACLLDALEKFVSGNQTQDIAVDFVNCSMIKGYQTCVPANLPPAAYGHFEDCLISSQGDELMVKHGDNTHGLNPKISFIPTIVIKDNNWPDVQDNILYGFKSYICSTLVNSNNKPSACE